MYHKLKHLFYILKNENRAFLSKVIKNNIKKYSLGKYYFNKYKSIYPNNIVFIAGFAKSGTTWLANMLSSLEGFNNYTPKKWTPNYMEVYDGMFNEFKNRLAIIKGHTWATKKSINNLHNHFNGKYLIVVRDPRDTLISAYWYIKRYPNHWDYKNVNSMDVQEYITYKLESGEFKTQFLDWLDGWYERRNIEQSMLIHYEILLKDTFNELKRIFKFLEFNISDSVIENIVLENSFKKLTGRNIGEENKTSFIRKGKIREWEEVFDNKQKILVGQIAKELLLKYNYSV